MVSLHSLDRIMSFWKVILTDIKGIKAHAVEIPANEHVVESGARPPAGESLVLQMASQSRCVLISFGQKYTINC